MVSVREMTEADIPAVSAIRVAGWRCAYADIVPRSYLDAMSAERDAEQRRSWFARTRGRVTDLVAVDDSAQVTGWVCLGPYRDDGPSPEGVGEVYALYVRSDLIGTGVGRALMYAAHLRAAELGFDTTLLWVLKDNARARRFYERAGYTADGVVTGDDYDGTSLDEVRYVRHR
ncbi:GNAT family N-acetyltransferase [Streptomyces sp. ICBB 8177]|uniref:GNAT family N-acetyltransferase n=1 Tax=Streptomyces sp. ICBB 8177 TaxID=563922 RepID=UPI000D679E15|nr:GNAT family N-acetyltransferase [Streptomyces sp. ICBB 8177]PWI40930.1 GNAT family N-acetyltransferase [Streptomyces sp. ICBB 8177]